MPAACVWRMCVYTRVCVCACVRRVGCGGGACHGKLSPPCGVEGFALLRGLLGEGGVVDFFISPPERVVTTSSYSSFLNLKSLFIDKLIKSYISI